MGKKIYKLLALASLLCLVPLVANAVVVSLGQVQYVTGSIALGASTTGAIKTSGMSLVGCQIPAAFTSTSMTFTAATTLTGSYQPLYNSSGQVSYTVSQGRFVSVNASDFYGVQFFKIITGSTEAAARSLFCSMKGI